MNNCRNAKLNKKFVQNRNYNQDNFPVLGEESHFINDRKRLIFDRNKPNLRASGLSLLPLALRPGLLMVGGLALVGAILSVSLVSSNSASAASISLSVPNTLSLNINSASPSGTFSKSDKAEISTKTDSKNGYTLSIKSKEDVDSNCLKNDNNGNKIESISSSISESEYESSGQMNTWAYQPTKFNSLANSNFLPAPTSSESIIEKTNTANTLNNNYGIVLAAKVNTDLPAGTYKNTYVLTATSNALTYSVHYNLNKGQGGPSPNPQTGQLDGDTFKLDGTTPTKEGFEFKGWCTEQTSDDSCSGGIFQPGSNYRIYCDDNDIELYAMWEKQELIMQDFKCTTLSGIGDNVTITDNRDGHTYKIAKLADNKCWMTENLRIGDGDLRNRTLTSVDSDVAATFTLPASSTSGFNNYYVANIYIDETYGGYYTWFAATAGEGKETFSSGDVSYSICPRGWRLPTKDEFIALIDALGGQHNAEGATKLMGEPNNFKLGGYFYDNSNTNVGRDGTYWSSTANHNISAYNLGFEISNVTPGGNSARSFGYSIRCVSRK